MTGTTHNHGQPAGHASAPAASLETPARTGARITISRAHELDVQHRQIYARIDDGPNRMLLFGDSFTVELAPGRHRLRANNTLYWKSVPFTIAAGDHLEFILINKSSRFAFGLLAMLGAAPLALAIQTKRR